MYPYKVMWIHNSDTLHKHGPHHTLTLQTLVVPPCKANGLPITIQAPARPGSTLRPTFTLTPPNNILVNKTIVVPYIQIQYSQTVFLNFGPLTWPHVSVATLIPSSPIQVPASVWT